jgi:hypothetical protein
MLTQKLLSRHVSLVSYLSDQILLPAVRVNVLSLNRRSNPYDLLVQLTNVGHWLTNAERTHSNRRPMP